MLVYSSGSGSLKSCINNFFEKGGSKMSGGLSFCQEANQSLRTPGAKNDNGGKNNGKREKTSVPSSGKFCPHCNLTVANSDDFDGEDVCDMEGKITGERRHKSCAKLAVAQSKDTELRGAANL